jgi:hypothetical protein
MTNSYLYGLEVITAGWSQSATYEITNIMQTASLEVMSIIACENRISTLYGRSISLDQKLLCTNATPNVILTYVSTYYMM